MKHGIWKPKQTWHTPLLLAALIAALLSGCGDTIYAPEEAATRSIFEQMGSRFTIDPQTVRVAQTHSVDRSQVLVLVAFSGLRGAQPEDCLFLQDTNRSGLFGWQSRGGTGSCINEPGEGGPVSSSGGRTAGRGPNDPGHSAVYGFVFDESIEKILITWNDGRIEELGVEQGTYLAARAGQFQMTKLQAFNADEIIVHTIEVPPLPGS
jgi:hypothetical protein